MRVLLNLIWLIQLRALALPFGRTVVRDPQAGAASAIGDVIRFIVAGI